KKNEFRAMIKHLHMKVNEFKRNRTCDAPRSGRPIEAATPEIVDKIHNIVLTDRRVNVRELVEATGISHGTISILHEQLDMKKLSARWVSRLLTVNHNAWVHTCPAPMIKFNEFEEMVRRKEIHHQRAAHRRLKQRDLKKLENRWIKLRNKNESIKKNVFYYVFLKTY
ncbi:hypothetical protein ALC53_00220, partial [Atta colombica]